MAKYHLKAKLIEARHLIEVCKLSIPRVAKRLGLKYDQVYKLRRNSKYDPDSAFKRRVHVQKFTKFNDRARQVIQHLLDTADHPLRLREFQSELMSKCQLRVS